MRGRPLGLGLLVRVRRCIVIRRVFLVAVLQALVQDADAFDAVASLLLGFEFETHFDLMVLLSLVSELILDVRVLVIRAQYGIVCSGDLAILAAPLFIILHRPIVVGIVFAELRYPEVEGNYLGTAFPRCYLDEIVHEEARLDEREGLAEAYGRELRDDD